MHDCEAWPFGGFLLRESVPYKLPTFLITTLPVTEQTTTGSECVYNYGNYGTVRPITCGGGGRHNRRQTTPDYCTGGERCRPNGGMARNSHHFWEGG